MQRIDEERPFEVWTGEVRSAEARKEIMKKLIVGLLFVPAMAQAEFMSGNGLLKDMNGDVVDKSIALGYVMGVSDAYTNVTVCVPDNVTAGQVQDIVRRYLENNPDKRHYAADSLIRDSLEKVWPCRQQGKGRGT